MFFAKFLGHYIGANFAVPLGVGFAVALTLWFSQLVKKSTISVEGHLTVDRRLLRSAGSACIQGMAELIRI